MNLNPGGPVSSDELLPGCHLLPAQSLKLKSVFLLSCFLKKILLNINLIFFSPLGVLIFKKKERKRKHLILNDVIGKISYRNLCNFQIAVSEAPLNSCYTTHSPFGHLIYTYSHF